MLRKVLPRFLKKNRNSLAFFRKNHLINAINNNQILFFFPTFNFRASEWLDLRRDIFFNVTGVHTLSSASNFYNCSPLLFSSTLNHFIVSFSNMNAFSKTLPLLQEKKIECLPTIVFFGPNCLNLHQKGFNFLYKTFSDQVQSKLNIYQLVSLGAYRLPYFMAYFSYFCFLIVTTMCDVLLLIANCCLFFNSLE